MACANRIIKELILNFHPQILGLLQNNQAIGHFAEELGKSRQTSSKTKKKKIIEIFKTFSSFISGSLSYGNRNHGHGGWCSRSIILYTKSKNTSNKISRCRRVDR
jgi:hypothetical protein